MVAINVPSVKLNDGKQMPQVGFGLWKVPNESAADIVYNAIKTGYRLFDGACGMAQPTRTARRMTDWSQIMVTRSSAAKASPAP